MSEVSHHETQPSCELNMTGWPYPTCTYLFSFLCFVCACRWSAFMLFTYMSVFLVLSLCLTCGAIWEKKLFNPVISRLYLVCVLIRAKKKNWLIELFHVYIWFVFWYRKNKIKWFFCYALFIEKGWLSCFLSIFGF